MNVKEMIEWLQTQDQEAIVQVYCIGSGGMYTQMGEPRTVDFRIDYKGNQYDTCGDLWEYTDFRGNRYVKEDAEHYNKRYLMLGGEE